MTTSNDRFDDYKTDYIEDFYLITRMSDNRNENEIKDKYSYC